MNPISHDLDLHKQLRCSQVSMYHSTCAYSSCVTKRKLGLGPLGDEERLSHRLALGEARATFLTFLFIFSFLLFSASLKIW